MASHGPLSSAIIASATLIGGESTFCKFSSIQVEMSDSSEHIKNVIENQLSKYNIDDEIIALTDIFGGNITNILAEYIRSYKIYILTGMNLGMVLEAGLSDESIPVEELINSLLQFGSQGICFVNDIAKKSEEENEI
ncbi:PTS sugar transporter subunit IIA [Clostridium sp. HCS.1]